MKHIKLFGLILIIFLSLLSGCKSKPNNTASKPPESNNAASKAEQSALKILEADLDAKVETGNISYRVSSEWEVSDGKLSGFYYDFPAGRLWAFMQSVGDVHKADSEYNKTIEQFVTNQLGKDARIVADGRKDVGGYYVYDLFVKASIDGTEHWVQLWTIHIEGTAYSFMLTYPADSEYDMNRLFQQITASVTITNENTGEPDISEDFLSKGESVDKVYVASPGEEFSFQGVSHTAKERGTWVKIRNKSSKYYGEYVIAIPISLKNNSDADQEIDLSCMKAYNQHGKPAISPALSEEVIQKNKKYNNLYGSNTKLRIPAGKKVKAYALLQYNGDGAYQLKFQNAAQDEQIEMSIAIKKSVLLLKNH